MKLLCEACARLRLSVLNLEENLDLLIFQSQLFTIAFALHSSMESPQSIRKVMISSTNTNQLVFLPFLRTA
jgi:hypothetical protein